MNSLQWTQWTMALCLTGAAAAGVAALLRLFLLGRHSGRLARGARPVAALAVAAHLLALGAMALSMLRRAQEVNHFPSQTMSEVIGMFCLALLLSLAVLRPALGLKRRGEGWAALEDTLLVLVLGGTYASLAYVSTLSTAQRDLPPALQSYWFPPHLSSLIFSYATLGIAGLLCLVYFAARLWGGVFVGGRSARSQWATAAGLLLVPFLHIVALPVVLLVGLVFWLLKKSARLPDAKALAAMEREVDEVSFRAFAVGFPFLTAGLWMGAFWAQEAWANYWGWDSKENSALITWLVYVGYIHLRMLGGYRGEKAMGVLLAGALSIFATFQLFGYLPDSQKSLHRYTDDNVVPREGMQGSRPESTESASVLER